MKEDIFNALILYCFKRHKYVVANAFFGRNECDVFSITHSNYRIEYEVKISRSDFFADKNKKDKHLRYSTSSTNEGFVPNRFFYVCPEGLINKEEVPMYAGLLYISNGIVFYEKDAPLLHKDKIDKNFLHAFADKMYHRYMHNVYLKKINSYKKKMKL